MESLNPIIGSADSNLQLDRLKSLERRFPAAKQPSGGASFSDMLNQASSGGPGGGAPAKKVGLPSTQASYATPAPAPWTTRPQANGPGAAPAPLAENELAATKPERPAGQRFSQAETANYLAGRGVTSSVVFENRNIKAEIENDPRKAELWQASEEMESLFLKIMLSSMRKNINKTKLIDGGRAEEIFEDMLYDEYAKNMANTENFGLAENLYEQMRDAL